MTKALPVALGAAPRDLLRLVVGEGLVLAAAGVAVGALGAALLSRSVEAIRSERNS